MTAGLSERTESEGETQEPGGLCSSRRYHCRVRRLRPGPGLRRTLVGPPHGTGAGPGGSGGAPMWGGEGPGTGAGPSGGGAGRGGAGKGAGPGSWTTRDRARDRNASSRAPVSGRSVDPDVKVRHAGSPTSGVSRCRGGTAVAMRQKHYLEAAARKLQARCPGQARYLL